MKRLFITFAMLAATFMLPACDGTKINPIDNNSSQDEEQEDNDPTDIDGGADSDASKTISDTVTVVFSTSGKATVTGGTATMTKTVNGNDVTITNSGSDEIRYILKGTTSDGFFKLYSPVKQVIELDGVSITNPGGAAINNQSHKKTSVLVKGTNTLADGSVNTSGSYTDETTDEDMKAAFFSEGQMIFTGTGSLTVTAKGKSGITSDDYLSFKEPTVSVTSALGHGLRGKDAVYISGGNIDVTVAGTGKKGINTDSLMYVSGGVTTIKVTGSAGTVDGELTGAAGIKADQIFKIDDGTIAINASGKGAKGINGDGSGYFDGGTVTVTTTGSDYGSSSQGGMPGFGWGGTTTDNSVSAKGIRFEGTLKFGGATVTVNCSANEGIESKQTINIIDGSVYSYSYDDAINAGSTMTISGGSVYAQSTGNDGLDANGNCYIKGGNVFAIGKGSPEVAIDANTEGGYKLYVSGGNIVAVGGIESGSSLTQPVATVSSWSRSTQYSVSDGTNVFYAFKTPSSGGTGMVVSSPSMKSGSSYTLTSGCTVSGGTAYWGGLMTLECSVSGGSSTSVTASTSSSGGGQGGGGNQGGPGRWW